MEVIGYLGNYHRRFCTKIVQKFGFEGFLLHFGDFLAKLCRRWKGNWSARKNNQVALPLPRHGNAGPRRGAVASP
ncbi:hypothetical protein [Janthinobacterium sp.]|uniref:hypothetical protein n=1 Tax=Janthinobacterium sp. TaxID=1871054 RepID=UPI00258A00DD|nr:hypothetical protein [Janthinobacterium sp.]MCX7291575.1 hypothetical protein [Janthinobacterium sp.]